MGEINSAVGKKIEKLTRAVNRRREALGRLKAGGACAVSERRCSKLLKQAQRRRRKLLDRARRSAKSPARAEGGEGEPA